jgi:hypothetical protein
VDSFRSNKLMWKNEMLIMLANVGWTVSLAVQALCLDP